MFNAKLKRSGFHDHENGRLAFQRDHSREALDLLRGKGNRRAALFI